jgi:4-amino-4-deoxy-L-arabinose transferase-like glycosyltransferase
MPDTPLTASTAENPYAPAATARTAVEEVRAPLIPHGNPLRLLRGGVTASVGGLLAYLLMAHNGQLPHVGVPLGILFVAIASWGVMDALGTFDDPETAVAGRTTIGALASPLGQLAVGLLVFALSLAGAASGLLNQGVWAVVVTLSFVGLVFAVFQLGVKLGPWATDELGVARPIWQRHGFWLVVASAVLLLPCLGSFSLWDPWETHYGEVSREILARDDWISTWWAQDGFFYSKPVLDFWLQAIFMATLGVHYQPGQMLQGAFGVAHPEWVVRAPIFLMTVMALYLLYKGVARIFGRRAGLLGGLVLATMPDWWFLAHQTMTDMPFVGATTSAMGLILIGIHAPEEERARVYEVRAGRTLWRLSAWHLVFGAILICAIPQILYLFSRNLELVLHGTGPYGFRPHWDEFKTGSGMGNCGLPGNEACRLTVPANVPQALRGDVVGVGSALMRFFLGFEPSLQALLWTVVVGLLLYMNAGERRVRRLAYLGGWFFAALATSAKGPAGFGLPILCGLAYVATTKHWKELVRFELASGLCIVAAVAIPWWVAMYIRHGTPFSDELIFHDLVNRAFSHVHDTNEGDDTAFRFYVWQLGYALFPWTGLAPLGLVYTLRRSDSADRGRGEASVLLVMWFVFAFALFSFMGTKFHHYIFPAVPPVAMLIGVALDDMLGEGAFFARDAGAGGAAAGLKRLAVYGAGMTGAMALAVAGVSQAWPGSLFGSKLTGAAAAPSYVISAVMCVGAAAGVVGLIAFFRTTPNTAPGPTELQQADPDQPYRPSNASGATVESPAWRAHWHGQLMFSAAAVSGALLLAIVGRDLIIKPDNSSEPGAARLLQLFTYRYDRAWPDALDFSAALTAFTFVAVALGLLLTVQRLRRHAVVAFLAFAFVWTVWGTDVYMVKTAPHWGQREILASYYADRSGPNEPIVAYQMNWKGENFYSGNQIPAFVSSGGAFTSWVKQQREKGVHVIYFVTEHGRVGGLKGEVQGKSYREVTDKTINNKFVLVRAEI